MREKIDVLDYTNIIFKQLKKGILVTTKVNDNVNSMVISWGMIGVEWGKLIFTVFVRENRFTKKQLDSNPEFTINIPLDEIDKNVLKICGTMSGKDLDKIKEANLTLIESETISVPAIKELPLTLECKVIYKQLQDHNEISKADKERYYPENVDSKHYSSNKDYHTAYYGEITNAYIIK